VHYNCCSVTRPSCRCSNRYIASFCPEWPLGAKVYKSDTPQMAGHSVCDNREPIPSLNMPVEKNKLQNLRTYILSLVNTFIGLSLDRPIQLKKSPLLFAFSDTRKETSCTFKYCVFRRHEELHSCKLYHVWNPTVHILQTIVLFKILAGVAGSRSELSPLDVAPLPQQVCSLCNTVHNVTYTREVISKFLSVFIVHLQYVHNNF